MNDTERIKYEAFREDHSLTFRLAGEYAKWFISTLLLLHSGAIAAVVQKGDRPAFACATLILAFGIVLALASGLAGWLNLQWASRYLRESANDILDARSLRPWPSKAQAAMNVAVTLAILSGITLAAGAALIWRQLF